MTVELPHGSSGGGPAQMRCNVHGRRRGKTILAAVLALACLAVLVCAPVRFAGADHPQTDANGEVVGQLALSDSERQWLDAHPEIRVGIDPNWPPFEFFDADGTYAGLSADYLAEVTKRIGIHLTPLPASSWYQALAAIKEGRVDMLPLVAKTDTYKPYMRFTRSYLSLPLLITTRRDMEATELKHLQGRNVGIVTGSGVEHILHRDFPDLKFVPVTELPQAMQLLSTGLVDAIVRAPTMGPQTAGDANNPGSAGMVRNAPYDLRLFIGVRRDWPLFTRILNKALGAIPEKRKITMQEKWSETTLHDHIELALFFQILGGFGAISLVIWGGVLIANRRLKKEVRERKRAEVALAKSFKLTQVMSDELPDFVCVFDVDGRYIFVNKKFEKWLCLKGSDVIGKTVFEVYPETEATHLDALNRRVLETRLVTSMEFSHTFPDGKFRNVQAKRFPIFNAEGDITAIGNINHDISGQKRNQQDMEEAKEQAEQANRAKSQFLSSMSHELRTPLNAILGFGQILQGGDNLSKQQKQAVGYILDGGNHLLELITEVLDLSRIEAGNLALNIETMRPGKVWRDSLGMAEAMAVKRNIKITANFVPRDLPYVLADRRRLKQVLLNFLSNAIKYNVEGGEVMVNFSKLGNSLCRFAIADTGDGIPLDRQDKLFTPFTRLADNSSNIEGTGIGLIITRELVRLMGGEVGFSSIPGEGSIFWFDLPMASSEVEAAVGDETAARDSGDAPALNIPPGTILYVEDNDANRQLMELILARVEGVRFLEATSAEAGLKMAEEEGPDLILMDINLPGVAGFEALEMIRKNPKLADIPVVAVSANAMEHDIRAAREAGFARYITKPFTIAEVHEVAAEMLGREKAARAAVTEPEAVAGPAAPAAQKDTAPTAPTASGQTKTLDTAADGGADTTSGDSAKQAKQAKETVETASAKAATPNDALLDAGAVKRLRQSVKQLPPEFLNILERQFNDVPQFIDGLRTAADGGDAREIEMLAHKMKGNCANFGASALTDKAQSIESLAAEGKISEVMPHIAELPDSFAVVKPVIRALLDELGRENA